MTQDHFLNTLKATYILDPTTQPTAFWKTKDWLNQPGANLTTENEITTFTLGDMLLLRLPLHAPYNPITDASLKTLVFAEKQHAITHLKETKFFKLFCNHSVPTTPHLNPNFQIKPVTPDEDQQVMTFINENYENIHVNLDEVQSWRTRPVYNADLWIWIIDSDTGKTAALGIAEFDPEIGEGALEWIQVDAAYRGHGLGKALVHTLVNRISASGTFTTVSGEVDNHTQPERLYKACGFTGERIWYVYR